MTNLPMRRCAAAVGGFLLSLSLPAAADAHKAPPEVSKVYCDARAQAEQGCPEGEFVALRGERLANVTRVDFLGGRGAQDDRHVHPRTRSAHRVLVRVPPLAKTGRVRAIGHDGRRSKGNPRLAVASSPAAPPATGETTDGAFPVGGRWNYGTATNRFGGGRNHQGQDIFASCGTPVVAAVPGKVVVARTGGNEGNYAVTEAEDGTQQAYLHMQRPAAVQRGDRVTPGQAIGRVGETGNASGCHLHFELWTAPGRFTGGSAYDPRPDLDRWAAGS